VEEIKELEMTPVSIIVNLTRSELELLSISKDVFFYRFMNCGVARLYADGIEIGEFDSIQTASGDEV
jgi:hypothetical protein